MINIPNELLKKYNVEEYVEGNEDYSEKSFYMVFLENTNIILNELIEGTVKTEDITEELYYRELARIELAKLNGEEIGETSTQKTLEQRALEVENTTEVLLGQPVSKDQAAEQLRRAVQMFAQTVMEDNESLSIKSVYPMWEEVVGKEVKEGFKFTYEESLYKVIQPEMTIEGHYIPGEGTESLYTKIDETHAGTVDDPIPYNGNMEIFSGKYYIQNDVIYECIRDSGTPLYHNLADLVGTYVEVYTE